MKQSVLFVVFLAILPFYVIAQGRNNNNGSYRGGREGRGNNSSFNVVGEIGSALTMFSESGDRFYLILNGVKQNTYPQTRIRIEDLPDVVNDIQIIFDDNRTPSLSRRIAFTDPVEGKAVNLVMKVTRDRQGIARLAFHKLTPLESNYRGETGEYIMHYGHDDQPRQIVNTPAPPPPPTAMDNQTFLEVKQAIKGSGWDDGKLSTAKTILNTNYVTTDQVIEICKLFSWDDNKLAFAKYAFKKTVDNNNYFRVNAVFDWDSNKQALNNYVNANR